jgi:hypothetical protein
MRFRLTHMKKETRKVLGIYLWQVFPVIEVRIETSGWKYPRETKWIYCKCDQSSTGHRRFLWYEGELINNL